MALKHCRMSLSFREARVLSLVSIYTNIIGKDTFVMLYDVTMKAKMNLSFIKTISFNLKRYYYKQL